MKAIQTTNNQGGKLSSKFHFRNNNYIKHSRNLNRTGLLSAFTFLLLALTCLFPISKSEQTTEAVTGTVQSSSLTLNVSSSAASVELDVNSNTGTFASSTTDNSAVFSVTTNNFSGYTLTISGNDDEGKLYDSTKQNFLTSLANATSEADFSSTSNTNLNGQWGYKPSKFNSVANANYLPAPTTTASTLDTTSVANPTANNYSISLGLRADYTTTADTYSNSFIITAVPNPIAYVITYDANTADTVSNMPAAQNSTTSATSITLSDKTPTRENYDFKGWCTVAPTTANPDTCAGTTFQPGDTYGIDQTNENITTLYAMWKINAYTVTFSAGTGGSVNRTTQTVPYGAAITTNSNIITVNGTDATATAATGYSFSSWTNNCGSTMPANDCTITANFTKNNYTITFSSNTGGTVNRTTQSVPYGTAITTSGSSIKVNGTVTMATANTGYAFSDWANDCGDTMPDSDCTITANWKIPINHLTEASSMQTLTTTQCSTSEDGATATLKDTRDNKTYTIAKINGLCTMTQNLNFNMASGMTLYPATTNVTTNKTITTVGSLTSGDSYDEPRILNSPTAGYGTYYNYAAATAGAITGSSNRTTATEDVCPKGWRLPTLNEQSSIAGGSYKWLTGNISIFSPVTAGKYVSGSLGGSGSTGYWWSSVADSTISRYQLGYYPSSGLFSGNGDNHRRYVGLSVRCVLK